VPWTPEDWDGLLEVNSRPTQPDAASQALVDVLQRIPNRDQMTVADFGNATRGRLPLLSAHFGNVLAVAEPDRGDIVPPLLPEDNVRHAVADFSDLSSFAGLIGVALAMDVPNLLDGACLDRFVEQLHGVLVEGGIVLMSVPAAKRIGGPVEFYLGRRKKRITRECYHEVEFQYRLRRAGFQGVRIQRFDVTDEYPGTLLCMAVRRTLN
jgi:hypothetical protein